MTAIWIDTDGGDWEELSPSAFGQEDELQQIVFRSIAMLPLAGSPTVVALAREVEVPITKGRIDIVGAESDGTPVLVEVKLTRNQEARKAVVSQMLSYAASLRGTDVDDFERRLVAADMSAATLIEAVGENAPIDEESFKANVAERLADGRFRFVLVLDEAPLELIRLVGYLEALSGGRLAIDLLIVRTYRVGERTVAVPQRIDPHQEQWTAFPATSTKRAAPVVTEIGTRLFEESIVTAPTEHQPALKEMLGWAQQLEADGLARLVCRQGATRTVLTPRVKNEDAGLMALWNDNGQPYLWLHGSVIERRTPTLVEQLPELTGKELRFRVAFRWGDEVSDELRALLTDGYRIASDTTKAGRLEEFVE